MDIMELINASGGLGSIAKEVGLSPSDAESGAKALLPELVAGVQQKVATGGLDGLVALVSGAGGGSLLDSVLSPQPTNAAPGAALVTQLLGSEDAVRGLVQKAAQLTGIDAATLQKMVPLLTMVLSGAMSKQSGGLMGALSGVLGGGSGSALSGLGSLLGGDDKGSNPLGDVASLAGKLFGG